MSLSFISREHLVAAAAAATLAAAPWVFGGVLIWTQQVLLAGGLLTLLCAVLPWKPGNRESWASPFLRLLRDPVFYFAGAFLLYLAIAGCNPAWEIASDPRGWWLAKIPPPLPGWLPTSVESPYEPMNPWRILHLHLAAFSLALGVRVGLRRRGSYRLLLWTLLLSTAAMAVVAIVQKYSGAPKVLWTYASENPNFWGSFFYRNQGAALLNWGIVIAGVLYFYHAARSRFLGRSGGPHFLAICLLGTIAVSVGLALSRGGILFGAVLLGLFFIGLLVDYVVSLVTHFSRHTLWITSAITLVLTSLLVLGVFQAQRAIDWEAMEKRFGDIGASIEEMDQDARTLSTKATWAMAQDRLWLGWGAGSFRYVFPMYQRAEPRLFHAHYHPRRGWTGRKFYRYAHNDILQFLAEYGIVGSGLLIGALGSLLLPLASAVRRTPLAALFLLAGFVAALGHAFADFIFHSPAFWLVFIAGLALVPRLLQMEARRE